MFPQIHAPWPVLAATAEQLNFRAPIQATASRRSNWSASLLASLCLPNPMAAEVPNPPPDYFTAPFRADKGWGWNIDK